MKEKIANIILLFKFEKRKIFVVFLLIFLFLNTFFYLKNKYFNLPLLYEKKIIEIKKGQNLNQILIKLKENNIIKNDILFFLLSKLFGSESNLKYGTYLFFGEEKNVFSLIKRLEIGSLGISPNKIVILEGWANYQIADYLEKKIENFNKDYFLKKSKPFEGYLYPDTYFIPKNIDEDTLIALFRKNFERKIEGIIPVFLLKNKEKLEDIIILASLVESEAGLASFEIKREVAGVLKKRLKIGMFLQVDAVFSYINKKHLPKVYFSHLEVDSPYNTYKNKGLPPSAISNPSLESIKAVLNSKKTNNLFYLTGKNGKFYFAKNNFQHVKNKVYLK